jgi:glycosyltransferase involved in cell wall biosynthesis
VTDDRVSVVIPVRNGESFLAEAIESVLGQSRPPLELIVVDDGSSDSTSEVAQEFGSRVRYVRRPPLGVAAALNCGIDLARGDFLAFLDADDVWTHDKLELQVAAVSARPQLDAVFSHLANVGEDEGVRGTFAGWSRGTMLIRNEAFARVGQFTQWRLGEFIEWYARAVDLGLVLLMLPQVLLLRRVHDANVGVRLRQERGEYARVLKAVLDRRRAGRL